jgi:hypothetical protein
MAGAERTQESMPMNRALYPKDWERISDMIRDRDRQRCLFCGIENGSKNRRGKRVVLTVAHLGTPRRDGSPGDKTDKMDVRPENLAALCQACHLRFDQTDHLENAKATRHRKRYGNHQGQIKLHDI